MVTPSAFNNAGGVAKKSPHTNVLWLVSSFLYAGSEVRIGLNCRQRLLQGLLPGREGHRLTSSQKGLLHWDLTTVAVGLLGPYSSATMTVVLRRNACGCI